MKCISCKHELDSTMKHALTINSCPFCGKNVFSNGEFDFRKSINRVLIKNGLEDEEVMTKIVDDISNALRENIITVPEEESSEEVSIDEDEDDGIGPVASRKLTPDPRRSVAQAEPKHNPVDVAMREWEASQRESNDDNVTHAQDGADTDDIPFFASTSNSTDARAESLKSKAPGVRPSFKNKPTGVK